MPHAPVETLLLLGGNVGDRRKHLRFALRELDALPGGKVLRRSRVYETAAVGPSRRPFHNMALSYRTKLSPMGLLLELKRLEAARGRRPGVHWGARTLDIDILKYGNLDRQTAWLSIPHPLIMERTFVLAPLKEIAPGWKPDGRTTVAQRLQELLKPKGQTSE